MATFYPDLTLYRSIIYPFAQRAMLSFTAAKILHKLVEIDLGNKPGWYFEKIRKSPKDKHAEVLVESLTVVEYIDDFRGKVRMFIQYFIGRPIGTFFKLLACPATDDQACLKQKFYVDLKEVNEQLRLIARRSHFRR